MAHWPHINIRTHAHQHTQPHAHGDYMLAEAATANMTISICLFRYFSSGVCRCCCCWFFICRIGRIYRAKSLWAAVALESQIHTELEPELWSSGDSDAAADAATAAATAAKDSKRRRRTSAQKPLSPILFVRRSRAPSRFVWWIKHLKTVAPHFSKCVLNAHYNYI